ncbi:MAG: TonB-dependent receptor [Pseudomonadota bacterium]
MSWRQPLPLLTSLVVAVVPAAAAEIALEEAIVAAERRDTALISTPVAVTAFDTTRRERLGIDNTADLAAHTPSLVIAPSSVSIRGVGGLNKTFGSDPGVGVYWDGVYDPDNDVFGFSRGLDLERIEVLRGPQGALYGRNTTGGAINYVSLNPRPWWSGRVVAEVANYDGAVLQGLTRGPVTEDFSILAAASLIQRDGFQRNVFNGADYEQDDTRYLTLGFRYLSSERWTNTLKLAAVKRNFRPANEYAQGSFSREYIQQIQDRDTGEVLNLPGIFPGQNVANHFQGLAGDNPALRDLDEVKQDFNPRQRLERYNAVLTSEYTADRFRLKYLGAIADSDAELRLDADNTVAVDSGLDWRQVDLFGEPVSELVGVTVTPSDLRSSVDEAVRRVSHEVQLFMQPREGLSVLGGLYYHRSQEDQRLSYRESNDELMEVYAYFGALGGRAVSDENILFRGAADLVTRSTAAYGQLDWDLTDALTLTFGLRYSRDEKEGGSSTFAQFVGEPDDATVLRQAGDEWSSLDWRLGLDYQLSDQQFFYGALATGFRSGGFNFTRPGGSTDVDEVEPEELISLELGYKAILAAGRVSLTAAAYYYDYRDIQVPMSDPVSGIHGNSVDNASQGRASGFELEFGAQLIAGLILTGAWSYSDSEYQDYDSIDTNACAIGPLAEGRSQDALCTEAQDLSGNQFPLMPRHQGALNLMYSAGVAGFETSLAVSYLYTAGQYMSAFNREDLDRVDSRDRWDARWTLASAGGSWAMTAFVKNINDDRDIVYLRRPLASTQLATADVTAPRTYGLRLDYRF